MALSEAIYYICGAGLLPAAGGLQAVVGEPWQLPRMQQSSVMSPLVLKWQLELPVH